METEISETGPAREVPRRSLVIMRKFSAKRRTGQKWQEDWCPCKTAWATGGFINLTILGTETGRGKDVESRRFKSKESVHARRQRGEICRS